MRGNLILLFSKIRPRKIILSRLGNALTASSGSVQLFTRKVKTMNIVQSLGQPSSYRDRKYPAGLIQLEKDLESSTTLYLGNLSFYTTEGTCIEFDLHHACEIIV